MLLKKRLNVRAMTLLAMTQATLGTAPDADARILCGSTDVIQVDVTRFLRQGLNSPNPDLGPEPTQADFSFWWRQSNSVSGLPVDCDHCGPNNTSYHGILDVSGLPQSRLVEIRLDSENGRTQDCEPNGNNHASCPDLGKLTGEFLNPRQNSNSPRFHSGRQPSVTPTVPQGAWIFRYQGIHCESYGPWTWSNSGCHFLPAVVLSCRETI